jgi:hypothetical protein
MVVVDPRPVRDDWNIMGLRHRSDTPNRCQSTTLLNLRLNYIARSSRKNSCESFIVELEITDSDLDWVDPAAQFSVQMFSPTILQRIF